MLQTIRERSQGLLAWIILILICIPFLLWGVQNYFQGGQESPLAVVGNQEIFQRDVAQLYEQNKQRLGAAAAQIPESRLKRMALENLINESVVEQAVNDRELTITDASIREYIQSIPGFQTDNKFDKEKYKLVLSSQRMSPGLLKQRVKKSLLMEQYSQSIAGSGFVIDQEFDQFLQLQRQQREVEYMVVSVDEASIEVTQAQIEEHYQAHEAAYQNPEKASVEYIELSLDNLAKQVAVTDDALMAYYEEEKGNYTVAERRKVSHILFALPADGDEQAVQAQALEAKQRLQNGENFAELAKQLSADKITAVNGGDLGLIKQGDMEEAFETVTYALTANEVSEPVKTSFGYHLIKVTELVPETVKAFDSIQAELREQYQRGEAENSFYELGEKLTEASYENPDSLEPVADLTGLTISKSNLFTRQQGSGITAEAALREAAFSADVLAGNNSQPIELAADRIAVLRILEHQPATVKPLERVKGSVVQALKKSVAAERAKQKTESLLTLLKQGETLAAMAASEGVSLENPKAFGRTGSTLPWELVKAVFQAPKPEQDKPSYLSVPLQAGGEAIVSLFAVSVADSGQPGDDPQALRKQLLQTQGYNEYGALVKQWRDQADIEMRVVASE